jgi:hypothetical protein
MCSRNECVARSRIADLKSEKFTQRPAAAAFFLCPIEKVSCCCSSSKHVLAYTDVLVCILLLLLFSHICMAEAHVKMHIFIRSYYYYCNEFQIGSLKRPTKR